MKEKQCKCYYTDSTYYQGHKKTEFRINQYSSKFPYNQLIIENEITAGYKGKNHDDYLYKQIVIGGNTQVFCGEPSCRYRSKGVTDSVKELHPPQP
ncbi:hypothetical protein SCALIN_C21_0006 [Candidatus Scalindua japonica]|uniref:Uncharacterized protein n=1 Tax=Candidatus Scalindua japonica TaxID=1284222 RepID=A0A286TZE9_9BACT|nr:hypothetical protein SCALIN_C21_0006 [Candidatus Scalindua japonica]